VIGLVCGEATIFPSDEDIFGYAHVENPLHRWERGDGSRKKLANAFCISLYAGAEAEKLILGSQDIGDGVDCDRATACLKIIGVQGCAFVQDDVWDRYEARLRQKAARLVQQHCQQIETLAQMLHGCGTLQAEQIDDLLSVDKTGRGPSRRMFKLDWKIRDDGVLMARGRLGLYRIRQAGRFWRASIKQPGRPWREIVASEAPLNACACAEGYEDDQWDKPGAR
jgi:hypothetical protein